MEDKLASAIAKNLKQGRSDWDDHFRQLADYIYPRRGLFSDDPANLTKSTRGKFVNGKMLDSTPRKAHRIMAAGMQAGTTSPSRPWFRWQTKNKDLRENPNVKRFISGAADHARDMLLGSGIYKTFHMGYGELGAFGTECTIIEDSDTKGIRPTQLVPGTYWLGSSDSERVDRLYREYLMTVSQIVGKFVFRNDKNNKPDWSKVPPVIKNQYDKGMIAEQHKVCHLITPRDDRDDRLMTPENKPIASVYWIGDDGARRMSGNFGYDRNPVYASRWETQGWEVWGLSPGMDILADCKELMAKVRDQDEMVKRVNRPPMNAHADLRNNGYSTRPGAINFLADPSKGMQPAYQVNPQFSEMRADIQDLRDQVWSGMYADLFLMISSMDRAQITATEIMERKEEKMIGLGPVIDRLQTEKQGPILDLCFNRLIEMGKLGEVPQELEGEELEVEYISTLAQAQKAISTGSIERVWSFAGNISAVKPKVLDKLDADQSIDEYAEAVGVPPSIIVSDADVEEQRAADAEQAAAMQAAEMAPKVAQAANQGAQAASVLAEVDGPGGGGAGDLLRKVGLA